MIVNMIREYCKNITEISDCEKEYLVATCDRMELEYWTAFCKGNNIATLVPYISASNFRKMSVDKLRKELVKLAHKLNRIKLEKEQQMKQYNGKDIIALTENDNFEDAKGRTLVIADGDDYKEMTVTLVKIKGLTIDYEIPNYKPKAPIKLYRYANAADKPRFKVGDFVVVNITGTKYKITNDTHYPALEGATEDGRVGRFLPSDVSHYTPRRMTNRELAKWCAEGKGQFKRSYPNVAFQSVEFNLGDEDKQCHSDIKIRAWDETEWKEPLI